VRTFRPLFAMMYHRRNRGRRKRNPDDARPSAGEGSGNGWHL
jgi:hypothetical protein